MNHQHIPATIATNMGSTLSSMAAIATWIDRAPAILSIVATAIACVSGLISAAVGIATLIKLRKKEE